MLGLGGKKKKKVNKEGSEGSGGTGGVRPVVFHIASPKGSKMVLYNFAITNSPLK